MVQRRTFLRQFALGSAALAVNGELLASSWRATGPAAATAPAGGLSLATFAPLRGAEFALRAADGVQLVRLADVQPYDRGSQIENFSLRFEGSASVALPEGTYCFEHAEGGAWELFVVARPAGDATCGYEAIVNRLV